MLPEANISFHSEEIHRVPTLDYFTLLRLSVWSFGEYWRRFKTHFASYYFPTTFYNDVASQCTFEVVDTERVILVALFLTFLRIWMTNTFFQPFALQLGLPLRKAQKIPENLWKMMFYSCSWLYSVYVMWLSGKYPWFFDPLSLWEEYKPKSVIPADIYCMYIAQCGFYLHSIYATIYLDSVKKDLLIMLTHHFLTLLLIGFSFCTRHYMEGALTLLLMDVSDVFLEFWKINANLIWRTEKKYYKIHDLLSTFGFVSFSISWFIFRLYWYPLKLLYTVVYGGVVLGGAPAMPFWPVFVIMLLVLYLLNCYWFALIIIGLFSYALGNVKRFDDSRELEFDQIELLRAEVLRVYGIRRLSITYGGSRNSMLVIYRSLVYKPAQ